MGSMVLPFTRDGLCCLPDLCTYVQAPYKTSQWPSCGISLHAYHVDHMNITTHDKRHTGEPDGHALSLGYTWVSFTPQLFGRGGWPFIKRSPLAQSGPMHSATPGY